MQGLRSFAFIPLVLLICLTPVVALAGVVTIDFEGLPDGAPVTSQYPDLVFSNATVLTSGISLNEFELPPRSGTNVVFDDGGPMTISFASPVISFGGYFTYYEPLTLQAFDAAQTQVDSVTSAFLINVACGDGPPCLGDPGSSPNEWITLAFTGGISNVIITGDPAGNSFVLDDVTYTSPVPEPSSIVLLSTMLTALAVAARRRAHNQ
jgi:hypothetical protein